MTKLLSYFLLFGVIFSQQLNTEIVGGNDSLDFSLDSTLIDTLNQPTIEISATIDTVDKASNIEYVDSLNLEKPLPQVRDPKIRVVEKLDSGESFFEIRSSIDFLKLQIDDLKKIISVNEEGKGAMPNIDEELLNLIKIPQLKHRIELQNGTFVNG